MSLTDKRLLIIYVLVVLTLSGAIFWINHQATQFRKAEHHFDQQLTANCQALQNGFEHFNSTLDQLVIVTAQNTALDPAAKIKAITAFGQLKLPIAPCPMPVK